MFKSCRFCPSVWLLWVYLFGATVTSPAVAGQYDGRWSGNINCITASSHEFSRSVELLIEDDKVVLRHFQNPAFGNPVEYEGNIELEDGFFSKAGDISVSGDAFLRNGNTVDWSLRGKWAAELIALVAQRGTTECEGSVLSVGISKVVPAGEAIAVETEYGGDLRFLLLKPDNPEAAVILFTGGKGYLGLSDSRELLRQKGSFLIGNREAFVKHGLMVAVIDAPSGVSDLRRTYRMSEQHSQDIEAVVWELKKRAIVPVWLIGHSRGTYSAANGAIRLKELVGGLILTSTVTKAREKYESYKTYPNGVMSMELATIKVPVMVLANKTDSCTSTPASNAESLAKAFTGTPKVAVKIFDGEHEPKQDHCKEVSQHHFFGFQDKVLSSIADFIKANAR